MFVNFLHDSTNEIANGKSTRYVFLSLCHHVCDVGYKYSTVGLFPYYNTTLLMLLLCFPPVLIILC